MSRHVIAGSYECSVHAFLRDIYTWPQVFIIKVRKSFFKRIPCPTYFCFLKVKQVILICRGRLQTPFRASIEYPSQKAQFLRKGNFQAWREDSSHQKNQETSSRKSVLPIVYSTALAQSWHCIIKWTWKTKFKWMHFPKYVLSCQCAWWITK